MAVATAPSGQAPSGERGHGHLWGEGPAKTGEAWDRHGREKPKGHKRKDRGGWRRRGHKAPGECLATQVLKPRQLSHEEVPKGHSTQGAPRRDLRPAPVPHLCRSPQAPDAPLLPSAGHGGHCTRETTALSNFYSSLPCVGSLCKKPSKRAPAGSFHVD